MMIRLAMRCSNCRGTSHSRVLSNLIGPTNHDDPHEKPREAATTPTAYNLGNSNFSPAKPENQRDNSLLPRASNPARFRIKVSFHRNPRSKKEGEASKTGKSKKLKGGTTSSKRKRVHVAAGKRKTYKKTIGELLQQSGESIPVSSWIHVSKLPPISSLDTILSNVNQVLDFVEDEIGILDLEAVWTRKMEQEKEVPPFLTFNMMDETKPIQWVQETEVVLSSYGRPNGWLLRFENRSVVHALLSYIQNDNHEASSPRFSYAWRKVSVVAWDPDAEMASSSLDEYLPRKHEHPCPINDSVVRVENSPDGVDEYDVMRWFGRYELAGDNLPSVIRWKSKTWDGKDPPPIFLVRFADPSWARAAIREKQGLSIKNQTIRLVQYP